MLKGVQFPVPFSVDRFNAFASRGGRQCGAVALYDFRGEGTDDESCRIGEAVVKRRWFGEMAKVGSSERQVRIGLPIKGKS